MGLFNLKMEVVGMWRHRFLIKGSEQELAWLNAQANRRYLLTAIRGNWYQFKKLQRAIAFLVSTYHKPLWRI